MHYYLVITLIKNQVFLSDVENFVIVKMDHGTGEILSKIVSDFPLNPICTVTMTLSDLNVKNRDFGIQKNGIFEY